MSNVFPSPFPFEQASKGKWVVHLEHGDVTVRTREDAELIALLPVELSKLDPGNPKRPDIADIALAQKVVKAYMDYHLYGKVVAARKLDASLKRMQESAP
jgi:hypothetical protein